MAIDNNQDKKSEQLDQVSDDEISLVSGGGNKVEREKNYGKILRGKITPCLVAYGAPVPKKTILMKYGGPRINNKIPVLPEENKDSVANLITGIEDTKEEQEIEE